MNQTPTHCVYRAECSCGWSIEREPSAANLPEQNNRKIVRQVAEIHESRPRFGADEEHNTTEPQRVMTDGGTARSGNGDDRDSGEDYHIGDADGELRSMPAESAALICLDDAWARPKRGGEFGVEYPTHDPDEDGGTWDILDQCKRVLKPGGWLIADADDWLLPRLLNYLRKEWGDAAETYRCGYRKVGSVTLTAASGDPDRSTPGMYGSTGGYPVVFAHNGETDRRWSESARQIARRPQDRYGWGSVKPTAPYQAWIEAITEPDETVVIPCAGTAPAAIAAERLGREWVAIDSETDARDAYLRRREDELTQSQQPTLSGVTSDD